MLGGGGKLQFQDSKSARSAENKYIPIAPTFIIINLLVLVFL